MSGTADVLSEKKPVVRRQILVDRSFQLSFLRLWLVVGLGLVALSALFYIFARQFVGARRMDPIILNVILGMGVFILLFCILMGTLSMVMAHRVAGAAYRIEKSLDRMIGGDLTQPVNLRKGDYLTRIAEKLNLLQERNRSERDEILRALEDLRNRLPASQTGELDALIQKAKSAPPV